MISSAVKFFFLYNTEPLSSGQNVFFVSFYLVKNIWPLPVCSVVRASAGPEGPGLTPAEGRYLGAGWSGPVRGARGRQPVRASLTSKPLSLPLHSEKAMGKVSLGED